jgi:hypothetical protein
MNEMMESLFRWALWGGVMLVGAGLGALDWRWRRPVFGALLAAGVLGGWTITKASPFTFSGGDHFMEGVILWAASGLALAGYALSGAARLIALWRSRR